MYICSKGMHIKISKWCAANNNHVIKVLWAHFHIKKTLGKCSSCFLKVQC